MWPVAGQLDNRGVPLFTPSRENGGDGQFSSQALFSRSFKGKAKVEYRPEGLSWELAAPMGLLITELP
jgi:hypothetical protein